MSKGRWFRERQNGVRTPHSSLSRGHFGMSDYGRHVRLPPLYLTKYTHFPVSVRVTGGPEFLSSCRTLFMFHAYWRLLPLRRPWLLLEHYIMSSEEARPARIVLLKGSQMSQAFGSLRVSCRKESFGEKVALHYFVFFY